MHNRKLLALAVAGTIGMPVAAYADTANVNVYGKFYPQYEVESAHKATATGTTLSTLNNGSAVGTDLVSRHGINVMNSYIGFKGEADAGGGMKGWFQIEQRLRFDTGTGTWAGRNSAAGISGAFGNVYLGNWDTVYKQLGDPVSFLGISSGNFVSTSSVLSEIGINGSPTAASFHNRRTNNIAYDSPEFGGVQVMVNFGPDEGKTLARNQYLYSAGVKWEAGPLYVALAQERHNDFFGGSLSSPALTSNVGTAGAHSKDEAMRVSAKYKFGGTEVGIDVAEMEYKETGQAAAGRFASYKHKAASLVATQKLGNLQLAGSFVKAEKGKCTLSSGTTCTTDGLGATQINLGAKYDFSKRVSVFGIAARIKNNQSADFTLNNDFNPGADPEMVAAGVIVSF